MKRTKKSETLPEHIPTENFRLTATTQKGDKVTVIVCGAPDSFDGAKTLGAVAKPQNIMNLLVEIDPARLSSEMGVQLDSEEGYYDDEEDDL